MVDKNIKNYVYFEVRGVRFETIKKELPFLEKLVKMSPHNPKCEDRRIQINYDDTYIVTENELGEVVPFYLGNYKYRKRGKDIEEIKE